MVAAGPHYFPRWLCLRPRLCVSEPSVFSFLFGLAALPPIEVPAPVTGKFLRTSDPATLTFFLGEDMATGIETGLELTLVTPLAHTRPPLEAQAVQAAWAVRATHSNGSSDRRNPWDCEW